MAIRILIVDDHRLFRAGITSLLNTDPNLKIVGEATSGEELLLMVPNLQPDVILMDVGMPGINGIEATKQLIQTHPKVKVLIMTMYEDNELVKECIRAGAKGYIIKRAAESELKDAIYAVWRDIVYIHPSLIDSLVSPPKSTDTAVTADLEPLSAREIEVLRLIVKGYSNRQIGSELNISVRTVETHRSNIMDKLNLHSRIELILYATERGLL